jgi:hypothetical protein
MWKVTVFDPVAGKATIVNDNNETIQAQIPATHNTRELKMAYLQAQTDAHDASKLQVTVPKVENLFIRFKAFIAYYFRKFVK